MARSVSRPEQSSFFSTHSRKIGRKSKRNRRSRFHFFESAKKTKEVVKKYRPQGNGFLLEKVKVKVSADIINPAGIILEFNLHAQRSKIKEIWYDHVIIGRDNERYLRWH